MIVSAWKAFWRQFGFYKEPVEMAAFHESMRNWHSSPFYTEEKRRNERLAQIVRERDALKEALKKAVKQKKARAPIYAKLRALSVEELGIEAGK